MSLSFVQENFHIGQASPDLSPQFIFYKKGFRLGGGKVEPVWRDIILHGNTALTLVNAKADSLGYLKLFGGTEQRNLPSGYTQVESITFDGSSYINTGIKANSAYTYKFKVKRTSPYNSNIWGVKTNSSYSANSCIILGWTSTSHIGIYSHSGATEGGNPQVVLWGTDYHTIEFNPTSKKLIIDGVDSWSAFECGCLTNENWSSDIYNLYLGGTNTTGSFVGGGVSTWAEYEVWDGGTLIQKLISCKNSSNVIGMYDTVTGNFLTNQGTGSFTAGTDVVPTPDNPMNIVCNNGVVKVRHQSGLPLGYKLLSYLKVKDEAIDLGFPTTQDSKIETQFRRTVTTGSAYVYRSDTGADLITNTTFWSSSTGNIRFGNNTTKISTNTIDTYDVTQDKTGVNVNGTFYPYEGGVNDFTSVNNLALMGSTGSYDPLSVSYLKHYTNNVLTCYVLPVQRESDSVYGYYDIVRNQFFTNSEAVITAGSTKADALIPYTDGTTETVEVTGKNLFTGQEDITQGYYLNDNGVATPAAGLAYTNGYTIVNGGTYTFSNYSYASEQRGNFSAVCYDENKNVLGRVGRSEFSYSYSTFTTLPNTKYLRFNIPVNTTSTSPLQLELGSTATAYEPYYNGGSLECPMLLSVGS